MGLSFKDKHMISTNENNNHFSATKKMASIFHSLSALNSPITTSVVSNNGGFLSHFRSWQRARKMKVFNSNTNKNNNSNCLVDQLTPMNNLCYQSVLSSGNRSTLGGRRCSTETNSSTSNHRLLNSSTNKNYYVSSQQPSQTLSFKSPIVSFMNQGEGKIAMQSVNLDENQLYSMNIISPRKLCLHSSRLDLSGSNRKLKKCISEKSCYVPLEPPLKEIEPDDPLNNQVWYYGQISRERAIQIVENCATGSFVVRKSLTKDHCYALTVRVPHDYNHTGVAHYLIIITENDKFKIKGFSKEFYTILSLITHHSIMKEQLPCTLRLTKSSDSTYNPTTYYNTNLSNQYNNDCSSKLFTIPRPNSPPLNSNYNPKKNSPTMKILNNNHIYNEYSKEAYVASNKNNCCELMVDIDMDPTYKKILDSFRQAMTQRF